MDEHGGVGETGIGGAESGDLLWGPLQGVILLGYRRHQGVEGRQDGGEVKHEPMVKVYAAQKLLEVHLRDRPWDGDDGGDFGCQGHYPSRTNSVPEESDGAPAKQALLAVDRQIGVAETLEQQADVFGV